MQSTLGLLGSGLGGGPATAAAYHASLEASARRHFPGNQLINCMCHSTGDSPVTGLGSWLPAACQAAGLAGICPPANLIIGGAHPLHMHTHCRLSFPCPFPLLLPQRISTKWRKPTWRGELGRGQWAWQGARQATARQPSRSSLDSHVLARSPATLPACLQHL